LLLAMMSQAEIKALVSQFRERCRHDENLTHMRQYANEYLNE
jgi:hypothetical protein